LDLEKKAQKYKDLEHRQKKEKYKTELEDIKVVRKAAETKTSK